MQRGKFLDQRAEMIAHRQHENIESIHRVDFGACEIIHKPAELEKKFEKLKKNLFSN